jgi:transposase-like protein
MQLPSRAMPTCSKCGSEHTVKNGRIHTGKQRFLCHNCDYQFAGQPTDRRISQQTRDLVDRLLLERISMAGMARAAQVSEQWLQDYVNLKRPVLANARH